MLLSIFMEEALLKSDNIKLDSKLLAKAVVKLMKQDISQRYKETGEVTDEDWEFCEMIDWHPVDELPPKPEHIEELKKRMKDGKFIKFNSVSEIFDKK